MATIHVCAIDAVKGPTELHANVRKTRVFGEDKPEVDALFLYLGADTIRVWPADPDRIRELGEKLIDLARRSGGTG